MTNNLFDNLIYFRKKNGYSQEDLANRINVSRQTISRWECGEAMPNTEYLIELASLYGLTIDQLIHGQFSLDEEPHRILEAEIIPDEVQDVKPSEKTPSKRKIALRKALGITTMALVLAAVCSIIATAAFILWGYFIPDSWGVAWTCFLSIPLVITAVLAMKTRKATVFCFPIVALAVFYVLSWYTDMWHPLWLIFLSIPIYYCVSLIIDLRRTRKKLDKKTEN